jgi:Lon protease-like protein
MKCGWHASEDHTLAAPLFPLPNVVFFPRAILPLHIFEERYKAMTADSLAGDRKIAMALLRPGWEASYYGKPAIEPVVCVGKIVSAERLDDGKYNFLLHGLTRARILYEEPSASYRIARLELLQETPVMEIDLANQRQRLIEIFCHEPLASLPQVRELKRVINSPMPTGEVADLIAFHLLNSVPLKQSLLAETDVIHRVSRIIDALEAATPMLELAEFGASESGSYN